VLVAIEVSLPAVAPFIFLPDAPLLALRVSNGIAILMLFLIGWRWTR
jgi:VIT1/CCC1 family predicted Fe2+/Mn2+ transporter